MLIIASLLVLTGSWCGFVFCYHSMHSDQGARDDALSIVYTVAWIGGTLGGIAIFWKLAA